MPVWTRTRYVSGLLCRLLYSLTDMHGNLMAQQVKVRFCQLSIRHRGDRHLPDILLSCTDNSVPRQGWKFRLQDRTCISASCRQSYILLTDRQTPSQCMSICLSCGHLPRKPCLCCQWYLPENPPACFQACKVKLLCWCLRPLDR